MPQLWAAATAGESVTAAAERAASMASLNHTPVFAGVVGGVGLLADELVRSLLAQGVRVMSRTVVRELHRTSVDGRDGWVLTTGPVPVPIVNEADALVIAVRAAPASKLLAPHIPDAAAS